MAKKESHIIAQQQDADALQNKIDLYEHKLLTNADKKDRSLKDKETVRKFFRLAKEGRELPSDADWQSLSYIICRMYPSFGDIQNKKNLALSMLSTMPVFDGEIVRKYLYKNA